MLVLPSFEFGVGGRKFAEASFPFGFQRAGHQTVLGLNGAITTFRAFGFVADPFDLQPPLSQGSFVVRFDIFFSHECGFHTSGSNGLEKGMGDGFIDAYSAHTQAK